MHMELRLPGGGFRSLTLRSSGDDEATLEIESRTVDVGDPRRLSVVLDLGQLYLLARTLDTVLETAGADADG